MSHPTSGANAISGFKISASGGGTGIFQSPRVIFVSGVQRRNTKGAAFVSTNGNAMMTPPACNLDMRSRRSGSPLIGQYIDSTRPPAPSNRSFRNASSLRAIRLEAVACASTLSVLRNARNSVRFNLRHCGTSVLEKGAFSAARSEFIQSTASCSIFSSRTLAGTMSRIDPTLCPPKLGIASKSPVVVRRGESVLKR